MMEENIEGLMVQGVLQIGYPSCLSNTSVRALKESDSTDPNP